MNELEMKVADAIAKIFYRSSMDKLEKDENLSAIHNCWEAQRAVIPIVTDSIRPNLGENEELAVVEKESELPKYSYKWARENFNHSGDEYVKAQQDIIDNGFKKVVRIIGGCP